MYKVRDGLPRLPNGCGHVTCHVTPRRFKVGLLYLKLKTGGQLVSGLSSSVTTFSSALLWSSVWNLSGWDWSLKKGLWNDTLWKTKELLQVLNTLLGKGVVVVLPGELSLNETSGGQGLHGLDDV